MADTRTLDDFTDDQIRTLVERAVRSAVVITSIIRDVYALGFDSGGEFFALAVHKSVRGSNPIAQNWYKIVTVSDLRAEYPLEEEEAA